VVEKKMDPSTNKQQNEQSDDIGNEILKILNERMKNPADAFVLLQQLSIYLWSTYKIDWKSQGNQEGAETSKKRLMNFVSGLIDTMTPPEQTSPEQQ
jgi:hypothetical protein